MGSPFAAAMRAADTAIGSTFGESVLITPRRPGAGELRAAGVDPTRPARSIRGVFTKNAAADNLGGVRRGTELQGMTSMAVAPTRIWFEARALARLGYVLRADDLVTLTDRPGAPSYAIVKRGPSDLDDATFPLAPA